MDLDREQFRLLRPRGEYATNAGGQRVRERGKTKAKERVLPDGRSWLQALAELRGRITTREQLELERALTEAEWSIPEELAEGEL